MDFLSLFTFIFAQIVPTFGGSIGSAGNGIVLAVSIAGFLLAFVTYLLDGVNRNFLLVVLFFTLLACAYVGFATLITPFEIVVRDLSILVKFLAMALAVLCGYCYYKNHKSFKYLLFSLLGIFGFHVFLYFDSLVDANSPLQLLYHFKNQAGGFRANRFPGTWNFPYNETVFLVTCALVFLFASIVNSNLLKKLLFIGLMIGAIYMSLLGTQARSGFIAFFLCCGYFAVLMFYFSLAQNRPRYMIYVFISIMLSVILFSGIWQFLLYAQEQNEFRHLTKLLNPDTAVSQDRLFELEKLITIYLHDQPWRILVGFGGSRGDDKVYLESVLNYIYNYGVIGFTLIVGPWIYMWFKLLFFGFMVKERRVAMGALIAHIVLTYVFLMGMSADILIHFRFIPMFYFFYGVAWKYLELYEKQHLPPRYPPRYPPRPERL